MGEFRVGRRTVGHSLFWRGDRRERERLRRRLGQRPHPEVRLLDDPVNTEVAAGGAAAASLRRAHPRGWGLPARPWPTAPPAQLTAMNGPFRRALSSWIARATSQGVMGGGYISTAFAIFPVLCRRAAPHR